MKKRDYSYITPALLRETSEFANWQAHQDSDFIGPVPVDENAKYAVSTFFGVCRLDPAKGGRGIMEDQLHLALFVVPALYITVWKYISELGTVGTFRFVLNFAKRLLQPSGYFETFRQQIIADPTVTATLRQRIGSESDITITAESDDQRYVRLVLFTRNLVGSLLRETGAILRRRDSVMEEAADAFIARFSNPLATLANQLTADVRSAGPCPDGFGRVHWALRIRRVAMIALIIFHPIEPSELLKLKIGDVEVPADGFLQLRNYSSRKLTGSVHSVVAQIIKLYLESALPLLRKRGNRALFPNTRRCATRYQMIAKCVNEFLNRIVCETSFPHKLNITVLRRVVAVALEKAGASHSNIAELFGYTVIHLRRHILHIRADE